MQKVKTKLTLGEFAKKQGYSRFAGKWWKLGWNGGVHEPPLSLQEMKELRRQHRGAKS